MRCRILLAGSALILALSLTDCGSTAVRHSMKPYRENVKAQPTNAMAYYDLGAAALAVRRYKEARRAFVKCIKLDPENTGAHMKLAQSLEQLEKSNEAAECYRRVVEIDSTHIEGNERLGYWNINMIIRFEMGSYYGKLIRDRPINLEQQRILNLTDMKYEEFLALYPETEEIWERLTRLESRNPLHWCGLGMIKNQCEDFEGSISAYRRALGLNPQYFSNRLLDDAIYSASLAHTKWIPPDPRPAIFLQMLMQLMDLPEPPPS